ncbi:UNVERIFIED_CONTAM: hypothetical protein FKN15_065198 [Acipenser sinensis]
MLTQYHCFISVVSKNASKLAEPHWLRKKRKETAGAVCSSTGKTANSVRGRPKYVLCKC